MKKWFNSQGKLVQLLLLFIPFVNYIVELLIRWEKALKTKDLIDIILAVISIFGVGFVLGWIDFFWVLLFGHLFLAK